MRVLQSHELDLIGGGRRYVHHSVSKHSSVKEHGGGRSNMSFLNNWHWVVVL